MQHIDHVRAERVVRHPMQWGVGPVEAHHPPMVRISLSYLRRCIWLCCNLRDHVTSRISLPRSATSLRARYPIAPLPTPHEPWAGAIEEKRPRPERLLASHTRMRTSPGLRSGQARSAAAASGPSQHRRAARGRRTRRRRSRRASSRPWNCRLPCPRTARQAAFAPNAEVNREITVPPSATTTARSKFCGLPRQRRARWTQSSVMRVVASAVTGSMPTRCSF
jgi:hypothetical protein